MGLRSPWRLVQHVPLVTVLRSRMLKAQQWPSPLQQSRSAMASPQLPLQWEKLRRLPPSFLGRVRLPAQERRAKLPVPPEIARQH